MKFKRLLALCLTTAMVFSTVPMTAKAAATPSGLVQSTNQEEIDDQDERIKYSGQWVTWLQDGETYMGTQKYTTQKGSTATLEFEGVGVQVTGVRSKEASYMNVYIDGELYQKNINTYIEGYSVREHEPIFGIDNLAYGKHTIKVEFSSTPDVYKTGTKLMLDSFIVLQDSGHFVDNVVISTGDEENYLDYVTGSKKLSTNINTTGDEGNVLWSVYPADKAEVTAEGELIPKTTSGDIKVKAQAQDGSMREATIDMKIGTKNEGDLISLTDVYNAHSNLIQKEYTKASWEPFAKALDGAGVILATPDATNKDVLKSIEAMYNGIYGLVIRTTKIVCIGDSITYGSQALPVEVYSYPAQLQAKLGQYYVVENYGVRSTTLSKESDQAYVNTEAFKMSLKSNPDIVIIMLGTNDSKNRYWKDEQNYTQAMNDLIRTYKNLDSAPKVMIATSPAVDETLDNSATADAVSNRIQNSRICNVIAPLQREVAGENDCYLIDVNKASVEADDWRWDFLTSDRIHPNNDGYTFIMNVMYNGLYNSYANFSSLDSTITKAEEAVAADKKYTAKSREALQVIIDNAKAERNKSIREGYIQVEVDAITSKVTAGIKALVPYSVKVQTTTNKLKVGGKLQFKAITTGLTGKVTWSLSNDRVGVISKTTGTFVAKAKGGVVVTATCGNYTSKVKFYVVD